MDVVLDRSRSLAQTSAKSTKVNLLKSDSLVLSRQLLVRLGSKLLSAKYRAGEIYTRYTTSNQRCFDPDLKKLCMLPLQGSTCFRSWNLLFYALQGHRY